MQHNNLDDDGIKLLGSYLKSNQTLEELDVSVLFPVFLFFYLYSKINF